MLNFNSVLQLASAIDKIIAQKVLSFRQMQIFKNHKIYPNL